MQYHTTSDISAYKRYTTEELRSKYLLKGLFVLGEVNLHYTDVDRAIVGGIMPADKPLSLPSDRAMLGADFFAQRREVGVINMGGRGTIIVEGEVYELETKSSLYIGRGNEEITFHSDNKDRPAQFFLTSYPAHKNYPSKLVLKDQANKIEIGNDADCNDRVIYQSIAPNVVETCQLVMGFTELREGNNWNTFPPHTHRRRMEIYSYFDLSEDQAVFHLMGEPSETRHIVVRNGEAVVSPSWSIHSGVGTGNYSFIWAMGGENQEFDDMDGLSLDEIA